MSHYVRNTIFGVILAIVLVVSIGVAVTYLPRTSTVTTTTASGTTENKSSSSSIATMISSSSAYSSTCSQSEVENFIPVETWPYELALDPNNFKIFVTNEESKSVSVINTTNNSVIGTIAVGNYPSSIVYDPTNNEIYVGNGGSVQSISVINASTDTVITNISAGPNPQYLLYDPANNEIYVVSAYNYTSIIDASTNTLIGTINGTFVSFPMVYDPANHYIYTENNSELITIDPSKNNAISYINGTGFPVSYDPHNNLIYGYDAQGNIMIINGSSIKKVATIAISYGFAGMAFSSANNLAFIVDPDSNSVLVLNDTTNTIIDNLTVGKAPLGIVYDPFNYDLYVANSQDNTVSVVSALIHPCLLIVTSTSEISSSSTTTTSSVSFTTTDQLITVNLIVQDPGSWTGSYVYSSGSARSNVTWSGSGTQFKEVQFYGNIYNEICFQVNFQKLDSSNNILNVTFTSDSGLSFSNYTSSPLGRVAGGTCEIA